MKCRGKAHKFGKDINTDEIIPARYLHTSDPAELAKYCMMDADPEFVEKMKPGDIIVAGENFGCGSSREHAPISIKAIGVSCVIAASFARIFYRNVINIGLPIIVSKEAVLDIEQGANIEVDTVKGIIVNLDTGKKYKTPPYPEFLQKMISAGGLMNYVQEQMKKSSKPKKK
jgi:3-isopropylmalate/(R)-2-methylmalate dehydratase small subunit